MNILELSNLTASYGVSQALFGVDLMAPAKPVTPNAARKIVPSEDLLAGKTERPSSLKLQPIDDKVTRRLFSA